MRKILLVDDNPSWKNLIVDILKVVNVTDVDVLSTKTGEKAIEFIEAMKQNDEKPDLVLMDIRLPGITGYEATERILAKDQSHNIYGFTMFKSNETVYKMKKLGAGGVINKQIEPMMIARSIEEALEHGR